MQTKVQVAGVLRAHHAQARMKTMVRDQFRIQSETQNPRAAQGFHISTTTLIADGCGFQDPLYPLGSVNSIDAPGTKHKPTEKHFSTKFRSTRFRGKIDNM